MKDSMVLFLIILCMLVGTLTVMPYFKAERTLVKEQEIEINQLRAFISSLSAQQTTQDAYVYKYISPMHELDKLTSPAGYRELLNPFTGGVTTGKHQGIDIVGRWHCEITPIDLNGKVIDKWYPPGNGYHGHELFGGYVRILHNDGWISGYGHLSVIYVKEGDLLIDGLFYRNGKVIGSEGVIGRQGNTGMSTGDHLHLSIQKPDDEFVNPLRMVKL